MANKGFFDKLKKGVEILKPEEDEEITPYEGNDTGSQDEELASISRLTGKDPSKIARQDSISVEMVHIEDHGSNFTTDEDLIQQKVTEKYGGGIMEELGVTEDETIDVFGDSQPSHVEEKEKPHVQEVKETNDIVDFNDLDETSTQPKTVQPEPQIVEKVVEKVVEKPVEVPVELTDEEIVTKFEALGVNEIAKLAERYGYLPQTEADKEQAKAVKEAVKGATDKLELSHSKQVKSLNKDIENAKAEVAKLQEQLQLSQAGDSELQAKLVEVKGQLADLNKVIEERDATIKSSQEETAALQSKVDKLKAENAKSDKVLNSRLEQINSLNNSLEGANSIIEELRSKNEAEEVRDNNELAKATETIGELESKLENLQSANHDLEVQIADLANENQNMQELILAANNVEEVEVPQVETKPTAVAEMTDEQIVETVATNPILLTKVVEFGMKAIKPNTRPQDEVVANVDGEVFTRKDIKRIEGKKQRKKNVEVAAIKQYNEKVESGEIITNDEFFAKLETDTDNVQDIHITLSTLDYVCKRSMENLLQTYESDIYAPKYAKSLFNQYIQGETDYTNPLFQELMKEVVEKNTEDPYLGAEHSLEVFKFIGGI